jgi:HK97 family phage prohead protease
MAKVYLSENNGLQANYRIDFRQAGEALDPWGWVISGLIPYRVRADNRDNLGFYNQFARGSFTWGGDVKLLIDHEPAPVLASLQGGSLRLYDEPEGLRFEAIPADIEPFWRLVLPALERRLGASPGFDPQEYVEWGRFERTHRQARLLEISLTPWPGFLATQRFLRVNTRRLLETSRAPDDLQDAWARREVYNLSWRQC